MKNVAIIGAGIIGHTLAIVFARAGHCVRLFDLNRNALRGAEEQVAKSLDDLNSFDLLEETSATIASRISTTTSLTQALSDADYVQECAPEEVHLKTEIFRNLDQLSGKHVILASSTSTIPASKFTQELPGRSRCIIAHPSTPPHILPLVEVCPTPWTSESTVAQTIQFLRSVGQVPTLVRKETDGFILNRLQAALVCEAYRLWEDGYASAEDIEATVRETLGMRWALMGPFETIALNASRGLADYFEKFGDIFYGINASQHARPFDKASTRRLEKEWIATNGDADWGRRRLLRDKRLLALVAHKREASGKTGT